MMLLDADVIIKRVALVMGAVIFAGGLAAVTWYNTNLKSVFEDGKSETLTLKTETQTMSVNLNKVFLAISDIKASLQQHDGTLVNLQQHYDRLQDLIGHEISALLADTQARDHKIHTELANLRAEHEKLITDTAKTINSIQQQNQDLAHKLTVQDQKIKDLQDKLAAEIAWRNQKWWDR